MSDLGGFSDLTLYDDQRGAIQRLIETWTADLESYEATGREDFWTSSGDGCDLVFTEEQLKEFRDTIWRTAERLLKAPKSEEARTYHFHFVVIPKSCKD